MTLYFIGIIVEYSIALLAGIYGLIYFKHLRVSFRWLAIFLLFSALAQFVALILSSKIGTNEFFYNLITPIYYILIYFVFGNFTKDKRSLAINNYLFIIGAVFLFYFLAIDINLGEMSTKAISIGNLVFSLASFVFFFDMIKTPLKQSPFKMSKFYFLFGFLFYHSSIIFFWAAEAIFSNETNMLSIAYLNTAMLFIYYCILSTALIIEIKNSRSNGF